MALINCPGCKKKISEHASSCPSCGFTVAVCPECDAPKIKDIEVCSTCGYPYGNQASHKAPMHEEPVPSGLSGLLKGKLKTAGAYVGRGLYRSAYKKKEQGKFKNGMPDGQWKYFGTRLAGLNLQNYARAEKPQLKLKGNWENGKAHGIWEWIGGAWDNWDKHFVFRSRQYKYGLADGPQYSFDDYENLKLKANWKDGRLHGIWEKFEQERGETVLVETRLYRQGLRCNLNTGELLDDEENDDARFDRVMESITHENFRWELWSYR